jgi:hypothetical protein
MRPPELGQNTAAVCCYEMLLPTYKNERCHKPEVAMLIFATVKTSGLLLHGNVFPHFCVIIVIRLQFPLRRDP